MNYIDYISLFNRSLLVASYQTAVKSVWLAELVSTKFTLQLKATTGRTAVFLKIQSMGFYLCGKFPYIAEIFYNILNNVTENYSFLIWSLSKKPLV
jgi:hypothetical protein